MTHPAEFWEDEEPVTHHPSRREIVARNVLVASLAFAPFLVARVPFEPTCAQKVYDIQTAQPVVPKQIGFTFSAGAAEWLGLDPQESLEQLLTMGFGIVRLAAYMDQSTEEMLTRLSEQIALAREYNVPVILAVGGKAPHYPEWYISPDQEEEELRKAFAVIDRFGNDPTVKYWQLSNEPFERSNGPEKEWVLAAIHARMREYDKPIIVTHLVDLLIMDDAEFRQAASYADIIGLNDFLQVSFLRDSCQSHVERYQLLREWADEEGVPLWITESQTQPWPAQIPFASVTVPPFFYDPFAPDEISVLIAMQDLSVQPRVVLHWEALKALADARDGDARALREIQRTIDLQQAR